MISFKEFLTEDRNPDNVKKQWSSKEVNAQSVEKLYNSIINNSSRFEEILQNGGIIFRGWNWSGASLEASTYIIDTSKSTRYSRDTNNFYQVCMDYSPELKNIPSRSSSIIGATHINTALQHGGISVLIPFTGVPIAAFNNEDMFFHEIEGESIESIGNNIADFLNFKGRYRFTLRDIPKIKSAVEKIVKLDTSNKYQESTRKLFYQFRTDKFDNFINKYFTQKMLNLKVFYPGDKLPIANNHKKGMSGTMQNDNRNRGNEVWFSGKAFSIDLETWDKLLQVAKSKGIKIHPNCRIKI